MARLPRIVVPGQPLHIVQRGNDRNPVFFTEMDYRVYLDVLNEVSRALTPESFTISVYAIINQECNADDWW